MGKIIISSNSVMSFSGFNDGTNLGVFDEKKLKRFTEKRENRVG